MTLDLFPDFACQRVFLGWDQPLIPATAKHLMENHVSAGSLDLSQWMCVLPTAQSSLSLSRALQEFATDAELILNPPEIITAGELAERLYEPARPLAIEFEQTLAWSRVLSQSDPKKLRPLLPVLPETDALGPWLEIGGTLRKLHADLASGNVSFADVVEACETDAERKRWQLLDGLFKKYLAELKSAGLSDPHVGRSDAARKRSVTCSHKVMLIGTSDLNDAVAALLNELEQELVSFIAAPESKKSSFDSLGRFKTDAFLEMELPLQDDQLIPAGEIADQATAASEWVTDLATRFPQDKISLGVTDDSQIAPLEFQLDGCGIPSYRHIGWTIASTSVGKLLDMAAQVVARPTWRSLAAFVRHGDVHEYLTSVLVAAQENVAESESPQLGQPAGQSADDLLVDLDQLLANHLPVYLDGPIPPAAIQRCQRAIDLKDAAVQWLSPFFPSAPSAHAKPAQHPIAFWCDEILQWIDTLYPSTELDPSGTISGELGLDDDSTPKRVLTLQSVAKVRELLTRFASLNEHLDVPITASSAFEMIVGRLAELRVGQERQPDDIQIHGWLDLALDDSEAMVVCGLNHPYVPGAVTSDPFLPGSLRSKLRLSDNDRRYARDLYAMQMILSMRKEVRFIVGKKAADGTPTPPSRLLSAASPDDLARRIRNLLTGTRHSVEVTHTWDTPVEETQLPLPMADVTECPVKSMSVTAFKSYLDCPYRFYLRYVLNLKPIDDLGRELAANQFGDLVHGAVEYYGQSDDKDKTDESEIYKSLVGFLHQYAEENFGDSVHSAVKLQIRQAEHRLKFVSAAQAERIAQGWKIHWTEKPIRESDKATVTVDGKEMYLKGRFDRIDINEITGQWAILDYKTHGSKPEKKHLKRNNETGEMEWIDLQLPLYRMMIPHLGIDAPPEDVQLGYFNVSDKEKETRINLADFPEPLMADADRLIHEIVGRIFRCDFTPTDQRVQYDDYAMILQTGVASRLLQQFAAADEELNVGGVR